ncbi:unnamed protein product, partial [Mesorhabditis spiculigera]
MATMVHPYSLLSEPSLESWTEPLDIVTKRPKPKSKGRQSTTDPAPTTKKRFNKAQNPTTEKPDDDVTTRRRKTKPKTTEATTTTTVTRKPAPVFRHGSSMFEPDTPTNDSHLPNIPLTPEPTTTQPLTTEAAEHTQTNEASPSRFAEHHNGFHTNHSEAFYVSLQQSLFATIRPSRVQGRTKTTYCSSIPNFRHAG